MNQEVVHNRSFVATGSFAAKQFTFVTLDANGQLATPGAGEDALGVIQDKPGANQPGAVCTPGDITRVVAGGSFDAGDDVSTNASGQAVAATSGAKVLGKALTAGTLNAVATIVFQPAGAAL